MVGLLYASQLMLTVGVYLLVETDVEGLYFICMAISMILFTIADSKYDKDRKHKNT